MKKTTLGVAVFGVIALLIFASSGAPAVHTLAGADFLQAYHQNPGAVLLDVRTPGEFSAGHLDTAVNVDFDNPSFSSEVQKLDPAKTYFVYCRSGNRSGQAVLLMEHDGFKNIYQLGGGLISNQSALSLVASAATTQPIP